MLGLKSNPFSDPCQHIAWQPYTVLTLSATQHQATSHCQLKPATQSQKLTDDILSCLSTRYKSVVFFRVNNGRAICCRCCPVHSNPTFILYCLCTDMNYKNAAWQRVAAMMRVSGMSHTFFPAQWPTVLMCLM